jgi:hypothetical protein
MVTTRARSKGIGARLGDRNNRTGSKAGLVIRAPAQQTTDARPSLCPSTHRWVSAASCSAATCTLRSSGWRAISDNTVSTELLYASYLAYVAERRINHPVSRESLGRFLRKVAQQVRPAIGVVGEHLGRAWRARRS